jgi:NAD(P)-dependent dehydrogenase (short-subunit alcohol dehydrogenase family)
MKRFVVTGANRGLGLEFVRQLLARGDRVLGGCRQPAKAQALNQLSGEYPNRLHVLPLDVSQPRSITEFAREVPLVFESIDALVNNAGVLPPGERFGEVLPETLEHSFRVNAMGPFLLAQALAERIADGGLVLNLSSRLGAMGETREFRSPSYALSKAALNMATVQLAHALRERGIRVLALTPGWVRTDMGGPTAEVAPDDSVAGLLAVADAATAAQSGRFLDWRREDVPW